MQEQEGLFGDDSQQLEQQITDEKSWLMPLLLSFLAGLSTSFGGLIVILGDSGLSSRQLSFALSFSAAVMITVSVLDLWLPHCRKYDDYLYPTLSAFAGGFIYLFATRILAKMCHMSEVEVALLMNNSSAAGSSLVQPASPISHRLQVKNTSDVSELNLSQKIDAEAGNADEGTVFDLERPPSPFRYQHSMSASIPTSRHGRTNANSYCPQMDNGDDDRKRVPENANQSVSGEFANSLFERERLRTFHLGLILTITLTLHNFPEGLAVSISTLSNEKMGASVALAVAFHNIPEGAVIAATLLASTGSRKQAFIISTLSGMSEPLGAFLSLTVFSQMFNRHPYLVYHANSVVGGVMTAVSLFDLIPEAIHHGHYWTIVIGMIFGSIFMSATILAID